MNRLSEAHSPYLLQHRDNPVHWWEWGPEALAEAKRLNRPILISIGYAACHWCHVMAHESFEDPEVAAVMNALFVNIKVDREERPDVDHVYMSALHLLGEQGGWPLTMFLTPEGEPFWGGTYFPKEPRFGRPGFVAVLREIDRLYRAEPERILKNRDAIKQSLAKAEAGDGGTLGLDDLDRFGLRLSELIDRENGGLQGAPKFPNPPILESSLPQVGGRRVDVHEDAVVRDALEERHDLREVVVRRGAAAGAMEHRRCDRPVARGGEAAGDVTDVLVHAERLLDHDDRGGRLRVGGHVVDLHWAVRRRHRLRRVRRHRTEHSASDGPEQLEIDRRPPAPYERPP